MAQRFAELMFSPAAKAEQERAGSRAVCARKEDPAAPARDRLGPEEAAFIAARDTVYLASAGPEGWPYIQHRGGPRGFLKVLDERLLGFAEFPGNKQYVTLGNLATDDRVSLFAMDYTNRRRLKLLGRARTTADPAVVERVRDPAYPARVERAMLIAVEAFDWNCPKYIPQLLPAEDVATVIERYETRITALEAELAAGTTTPA